MKRIPIVLPLLLALAACGRSPQTDGATLILNHGVVWSGQADAPRIEAVAIRGDRIAALGSNAEIEAYRSAETEVVDLAGRFLMPGFMDNHTHFVSGGFQLLGLDLRSAATEDEFASRIAAYAGKLGAGEWILGGDWDHEAWPTRAIPRKELIDGSTPDNPVLVNRMDGHMALANSLALKMAGISRSTPDPPGGRIVRDSKGEPTGMLKDAAMDLVLKVVPQPSDDQVRRAALAALRHARELGVTAVSAMASFQDLRVFQELLKEGLLTARIYVITPLPEYKVWSEAGVERGFGGDYLKVGAVKGFMDGSLGSTTAWFHEPYEDAPETSGIPSPMWFPEGNMARLVEGADAARLHLAIHAIGDRANDELLDIFEGVVKENGLADRRFRVEHAQHLTRAAINRFAKLGVVASMQPYHAIDDGRWAERRIGPERIKTTYAFRSLIDAGVRVTFGSDWTVAPLNPLLGVYAAVTRRTLDGANPGGWVPEEKISVTEALECYTRNNAYAMFMENDLGTIEVGKLADFSVLSADPRDVDPVEIQNIEVVRTIVGGKSVFQKPQ